MEQQNSDSRQPSVGGIWVKETQPSSDSAEGQQYLSITIEPHKLGLQGADKVYLVAFKNNFKTDSEADKNKPDYKVLVSRRKPQ